MKKGFHKKLCASDRSGQPEITLGVIEARNLSENTRVEQTHDGSGQPDECNSSRAHTVKEQHAPDEHREIASFNTNNEFNRVINEEDIEFNVPGVPHSTVKQLHGASVRDLIQKIENRPNRHALQRDLQQSQPFTPFSQESKEMIHEVGNVESCELLDMEPKAQCKDHTHHITAEEISVYRNNWWLRSNTVGSDTMPVRHRADFKQAMSTLRQLKHQEDTAYYQKMAKLFLILVELARILVAFFF